MPPSCPPARIAPKSCTPHPIPPSSRACQIASSSLPATPGDHHDQGCHQCHRPGQNRLIRASVTVFHELPLEYSIARRKQIAELIGEPRERSPHSWRRKFIQMSGDPPPPALHHELHQNPSRRKHGNGM